MATKKKTHKRKKSTPATRLQAAITAVAAGHKGATTRLRKAINAHAKVVCKLASTKKRKTSTTKKKTHHKKRK